METVIISPHKSATPEYFKSTLGVKLNIELKIAAPILSDISLFPPEKVRLQKDFKNWNFLEFLRVQLTPRPQLFGSCPYFLKVYMLDEFSTNILILF